MSNGEAGGYLPGDPRYGLSGEALKDYYRTKAAQWAIYCWDKLGMAEARRALLPEQQRYVKNFGKRAADYRRKGMQQFLCTGPKTGTPEFFREHLHAHESYFASYADSFIFRGPIRSADGADNIGTALLLELPDRAAAEAFWNNEPFARNGGYQRDARIVRWVFGD
jgi:uncharacterized protein YciI